MANKIYQNQKITLRFSKSEINKAGRSIRHSCAGEERAEAILKIQNYREWHLYPLMLIKNHIYSATKKISKTGIVARRLKMLSTIIDKLERPTLDGERENAIQLTRMQDIGGCRSIVKNKKQLEELLSKLKNSRSVHQIIKTFDYLTPKASGYSGVHLVYNCFLGAKEESEWKGTKIEVQLRTELQHAWATSLEIIDTLEGFKLKTSMDGHPEWRRFFQLSGRLVAHEEKFSLVPENELHALVDELKVLESQLQVRSRLFRYNLAIHVTTNTENLPKRIIAHQGMFLVNLFRIEKNDEDKEDGIKLTVKAFDPKDLKIAMQELADSEADKDVMISVMVSAGDVRNLRKAYPNYFGSTHQFQKFLTKHVAPEK